ncbi:MAG: hypothetical protein LBD23_18840 [Oscillospiraceae bacterium]|nr:hypothetical protein [Oscillospiraceae bacterium]
MIVSKIITDAIYSSYIIQNSTCIFPNLVDPNFNSTEILILSPSIPQPIMTDEERLLQKYMNRFRVKNRKGDTSQAQSLASEALDANHFLIDKY